MLAGVFPLRPTRVQNPVQGQAWLASPRMKQLLNLGWGARTALGRIERVMAELYVIFASHRYATLRGNETLNFLRPPLSGA